MNMLTNTQLTQENALRQRVLRRRDLATACLTESVYRAGSSVPRHAHDHNQFCVLLKGGCSAAWNDHETKCESGAIVFHPAHMAHWDCIPDRDCSSLKIQWRTADRGKPIAMPEQAAIVSTPFLKLLTQRIYSEFLNQDDYSSIALEGLLLIFLAEFRREVERSRIRRCFRSRPYPYDDGKSGPEHAMTAPMATLAPGRPARRAPSRSAVVPIRPSHRSTSELQ